MTPQEYALVWLRAVREQIEVELVCAESNPSPDAKERADAYRTALEYIDQAIGTIGTGKG